MCLLHFPVLGIYIYASTESILKNALTKIGLHKFASERIATEEGNILCIDRNGNITRSEFNPAPHYYKFYTPHGWYDNYDYYDAYEQTLLDLCHCYGVDEYDVLLLFEYGYTADEVEEMLLDHSLLHAAINDIKFGAGESLYENCYGGVF